MEFMGAVPRTLVRENGLVNSAGPPAAEKIGHASRLRISIKF